MNYNGRPNASGLISFIFQALEFRIQLSELNFTVYGIGN